MFRKTNISSILVSVPFIKSWRHYWLTFKFKAIIWSGNYVNREPKTRIFLINNLMFFFVFIERIDIIATSNALLSDRINNFPGGLLRQNICEHYSIHWIEATNPTPGQALFLSLYFLLIIDYSARIIHRRYFVQLRRVVNGQFSGEQQRHCVSKCFASTCIRARMFR